jgi:hypothetical protein
MKSKIEQEKIFERIYDKAQRLEHLQEIATLCKKSDGWDMIIRVYSDDHGILFDKTQSAHAHILNLNGQLLGKFALTKEKPRNILYVFDCWKKTGKLFKYLQNIKIKLKNGQKLNHQMHQKMNLLVIGLRQLWNGNTCTLTIN